jgi:2,3-bisphosphoglycerate-dependent phosphoglycerate mutase
MTIYVMRHAQSDGNNNPLAYGRVGDANVGVTETGWRQAARAGEFFAPYLLKAGHTTWPRLWSSSFLRPRQTLSGVLYGMEGHHNFPGVPQVFEDPNLIEQSYGWLPYGLDALSHQDLQVFPDERVQEFSQMLQAFSKVVYGHTKFTAQPAMGESPLQMSLRMRDFMSTLWRDIHAGTKDHVIVTHGATIKALILRCFHLPMSAWDELATPGNADIFRIDQDEVTGRLLGIRKIFDGEAGVEVDLNPIAGIEPLGLDDLPPVPDFLRKSGPLRS